VLCTASSTLHSNCRQASTCVLGLTTASRLQCQKPPALHRTHNLNAPCCRRQLAAETPSAQEKARSQMLYAPNSSSRRTHTSHTRQGPQQSVQSAITVVAWHRDCPSHMSRTHLTRMQILEPAIINITPTYHGGATVNIEGIFKKSCQITSPVNYALPVVCCTGACDNLATQARHHWSLPQAQRSTACNVLPQALQKASL
jgi:hypothetical protein